MGKVWWVILVKQDWFLKNNTEIVLTKLQDLFYMKRTDIHSPFCSNQLAYYLHLSSEPQFCTEVPTVQRQKRKVAHVPATQPGVRYKTTGMLPHRSAVLEVVGQSWVTCLAACLAHAISLILTEFSTELMTEEFWEGIYRMALKCDVMVLNGEAPLLHGAEWKEHLANETAVLC